MNRPRTPRYWPRMKVRGTRRKREGIAEVMLWLNTEAFTEALKRFAELGTSIMKEDHADD